MIKFKELYSDDEYIQKELDMLKELNPIFVRIEELPENYEIPVSNIEAAESLHSDKGYSLGTPEALEEFESKRGYKL
jgi:hypothetical protein